MTKLAMFFTIHSLVAFVLGFAGIVAVLTLGHVNAMAIIVSAAIGIVVAIPVAWVINNKLMKA